jgi:hypothetical protein
LEFKIFAGWSLKFSSRAKLGLVGSALGFFWGCPKSNFSGGKPVQKPPSVASPSIPVPPEPDEPQPPAVVTTGSVVPTDPKVSPPTEPTKECFGEHRALRIAFLVDNSASMSPSKNLSPGAKGYTSGTDPALAALSSRMKQERMTKRQDAIYKIVSDTLEKDAAAKAGNSIFVGSEIGMSYFPKNSFEDVAVRVSERPPLNLRMNNLLNVSNKIEFLNQFWNTLDFTHVGDGRTPYLAALREAKELLKNGKSSSDTRRDMLVFLTDGLPSDESPSLVKAAKTELVDTDVVYLRLFDSAIANDDAFKVSIREAFLDENVKWGRKQDNVDKYTVQDFERYWSDLLAIPEAISSYKVAVSNTEQIKSTLGQIVNSYQKCAAK